MGLFRTKVPSHLIPVNPQYATSNDWVILLEAGTIIGPSPERLRVARSTLERKIVKKHKFMRAKHFLVLEGYDPRIHAVFFCPQLYKYDSEKKLVPLQGEIKRPDWAFQWRPHPSSSSRQGSARWGYQ